MLWAFAGIAVVVTVTPGAATAMVVRSALRGGWRAGLRTIAGNEVGVVAWALTRRQTSQTSFRPSMARTPQAPFVV